MRIKDMVSRINQLTGQGLYRVDELLPYLDDCIDAINEDLAVQLPTVTAVYEDDFSYTKDENPDDYAEKNENNNYTRIPDSFLRNYLCYEVSWQVLRDEDEAVEVYAARADHADKWRKKLISTFSDFVLDTTESVLVNKDALDNKKKDPRDDTALGYYNPYGINLPDE